MPELFVKKTSFKLPCPTHNCKNMSAFDIGVERGPGILTQRFCKECFIQIIRKTPADVIEEALGDLTDEASANEIEELKTKITELEASIEAANKDKSELETKISEFELTIKRLTTEPSCKNCALQFSKKTDEPCKSCKESQAQDKGCINFKAR